MLFIFSLLFWRADVKNRRLQADEKHAAIVASINDVISRAAEEPNASIAPIVIGEVRLVLDRFWIVLADEAFNSVERYGPCGSRTVVQKRIANALCLYGVFQIVATVSIAVVGILLTDC